MDKYYILKRILYTNYDIVKFDIITIDNIIKLIEKVDVSDNYKMCFIIYDAYNKILSSNVRETIRKMTYFLGETIFTMDSKEKIISNLYIISEVLKDNKKRYETYINLIQKYE